MTSPQERLFQQQISENPADCAARLVFADWLEEQNDPRAAEIRAQCKYRLPITQKEVKHLEAIAQALCGDAEEVQIEISDSDIGRSPIDPAEVDRLKLDLGQISRKSLTANFPRDRRGRLELGTTVLLAKYNVAAEAEVTATHDLCLAAISPERRKDAPAIRIQLVSKNILNFEHGWFKCRDWWSSESSDGAASASDMAATWRLDPRLAEATPLGDTAKLRELQAKSQPDASETISLATLLLDTGRFEEAMSVCGVAVCSEVSRMLNNEEFSIQGDGGCDCQFDKPKAAEKRASQLRRVLWESAPWNFQEALSLHEQRLNARRRSYKDGLIYLYIVPAQIHSRRARLTISRDANDAPQLTFQFSASNTKAWRWTWTRPVQFDIARSQGRKTPKLR